MHVFLAAISERHSVWGDQRGRWHLIGSLPKIFLDVDDGGSQSGRRNMNDVSGRPRGLYGSAEPFEAITRVIVGSFALAKTGELRYAGNCSSRLLLH